MTPQDKELLAQKGISEQQIMAQLASFKTGFPYLHLSAAASVANGGIYVPTSEEEDAYQKAWQAYANDEKVIVKFVPASGAASRMFKNLFAFLDAEYDTPQTDFEKTFFNRISDFAFAEELDEVPLAAAGDIHAVHLCPCKPRLKLHIITLSRKGKIVPPMPAAFQAAPAEHLPIAEHLA